MDNGTNNNKYSIELYFDEHFEFLDWLDNIYINDLTNIDENTRLTNTILRQSYITLAVHPFMVHMLEMCKFDSKGQRMFFITSPHFWVWFEETIIHVVFSMVSFKIITCITLYLQNPYL